MLLMWWVQSSKVHVKARNYGVKVEVVQTEINRTDMHKIFVVSPLVRQLAGVGNGSQRAYFVCKERERND